jgi:hypothetical protein
MADASPSHDASAARAEKAESVSIIEGASTSIEAAFGQRRNDIFHILIEASVDAEIADIFRVVTYFICGIFAAVIS